MTHIPMVATKLSFVNGSLVPKGGVANVPTAILKPRAEREGADEDASDKRPRNSNFKPIKRGQRPPVAVMAAIAPTGPNPTAPQQLPPGTISQGAGFFNDGVRLVGEGSEAAANAPAASETFDADEVEADEPQRQFGTDDAGDSDEDDAVATAIVEGTVEEVEKALVGLNADQLDAVERAEASREGGARTGVTNAVKAARGRLAD